MSYTVTLIKPHTYKRNGVLKAIANDNEHGVAFCIFPYYWNGLSLYFLPNEGKQFEVSKLVWNNGYYKVDKEDIIREITQDK